MKKLLWTLTITSAVLLSGCSLNGAETLTCSLNQDNNGLTSDVTYKIDYKDNDVKKIVITYDYTSDNTTNTDNIVTDTDTMDTTDTTDTTDMTNDNASDDSDEIVGGVTGEALDDIIDGVTDTILDIAGLRTRHNLVESKYKNTEGLDIKVDTDDDNHYKVIYTIDYDKITDNDLNKLGFSHDLDTLRTNYINAGYTCE